MGPLLLMVSGGSDSVALLQMIPQLAPNTPVRVLHVNHMIRGAAADADAAFVRGLCAQLGVDCVVRCVDVPAIIARDGGNLEAVARRERYAIANRELDAFCHELGVDPAQGRLVLAHTASDRAEGFFMRSIIGGGAEALLGMREHNERARTWRPLLHNTREELQDYLREHGVRVDGQLWREDASNQDTERFRAFVRHEVIGRAKAFNPQLEHNLDRNLEILADESALLDQLTQDALARLAVWDKDGTLLLNIPQLLELPLALQRRALYTAIHALLPQGERLDGFHIDRLLTGCGTSGFAADLPCGIHAGEEYGKLALTMPSTRGAGQGVERYPSERPLPCPTEFGAVDARLLDSTDPQDAALIRRMKELPRNRAIVDADLVDAAGALLLGTPLEGERMQPLGMGGHSRKLADLMQEARIPQRKRAAWPVLRAGKDVVWLPGVCVSERFKCTPQTKRHLMVAFDFED
ncbi:MAG: tRNA lysidine(34) synthetase TilS, partial [Coriobacteriales bacterium]|nr:tRNA lysidine(34) synthetase TilS [Coriobacteriales bacterium]